MRNTGLCCTGVGVELGVHSVLHKGREFKTLLAITVDIQSRIT